MRASGLLALPLYFYCGEYGRAVDICPAEQVAATLAADTIADVATGGVFERADVVPEKAATQRRRGEQDVALGLGFEGIVRAH